MESTQKTFVTTRKAADMLDVSLSTIQLWADKGLLKLWTTEGGHRRIIKSSIEEMLHRRDLSAEEKQTPASHELSVLVVEDDPAQQKIYQQQFAARSLPINLILSNSGFEGLIQIGRYTPDIIITDLNMPDMDGFELVRALENVPELQNCLIVAVSSLDQWEIEKRGGLPERVSVYAKPIPFNILVDLIRERCKETPRVISQ
ncbi:MAG: response regulator [Pseudomonadales bacterium]|nr:response regulator [Pseudomonadales bacterium]